MPKEIRFQNALSTVTLTLDYSTCRSRKLMVEGSSQGHIHKTVSTDYNLRHGHPNCGWFCRSTGMELSACTVIFHHPMHTVQYTVGYLWAATPDADTHDCITNIRSWHGRTNRQMEKSLWWAMHETGPLEHTECTRDPPKLEMNTLSSQDTQQEQEHHNKNAILSNPTL